MDDLLKEFVNESREHLATIEADLLTIEEGGANVDGELVNKVFRAAHSIKGGSGFFGLQKVKELAHKAETVLDMLRSKKMTPNAEITNVLLSAFDRLREMINNPDESGTADIDDLVANLVGLASSYLPQEQKASLSQEITLKFPDGKASVTIPLVVFDRVKRSGQFIYCINYDLIHDIEKQGKNVLQIFRDFGATGEVLDCTLDFEAAGSLDGAIGNSLPLRLIFATVIEPDLADGVLVVPKDRITLLYTPGKSVPEAVSAPAIVPPVKDTVSAAAPKTEAAQAAEPAKEAAPAPKPASGPAATQSKPTHQDAAVEDTLRVNVKLLETLMNLTGELVLSRNQLRSAIGQNNMRSLAMADQRLNLVTSELQEAVMRTRLQPIGNVFGKFPRVVRDMAASLGKEIQLDIEGRDVALDRSLIEGLSDPLTHMVRNSVDHGVETPEERAKAGKKRIGSVRIEARHEAGQVVVEIADDGKGIDPKKVAAAALKKGLVTEEKLRTMSDQDKVALIFLPGLSTAEKVTDISGRGVGMDVAKTNLDRLGGKIEIKSEVGKGSLFRIKLPLTLAIIPSLIVSIEGERFAIPQINVEELLRIRAEEVKKRIEVVGDAEVLLLRDKIIPLVRFNELLGLLPTYIDPATGKREIDRRAMLADRRSPHHPLQPAGEAAEPEESGGDDSRRITQGAWKRSSNGRRRSATSALEIVVVTNGVMQIGLVVGAFHNTEEIVVKPLGRHLKGLREYAGATILGDGTVALIIDIGGLAAKAELAMVSGSARAAEKAQEAERERLEDVHSLLLFHNAPDEVCATPLDSVLRVEKVTPEQVETAGGRRTLQYRGRSLPLVTLADAAQVKPIGDARELAVIVSNVHGREVGLLGAMPVDVIETKADIDQTTHRQKGIAGSAIIREKTTLLTDLFEIVDTVYPEWGAQKEADRAAPSMEADGPRADAGPMPGATTILLAEDSDFFRAQVKRFLEGDGFAVLDAPDGQAAWELLQENVALVNVVVTDIEMPRMTGIDLARKIRGDERTAHLPIIAVTSLAAEDEISKGKAAGIDDYQIKLDREKLLESVRTQLAAVDKG
jgi:two-component system, chemotaxis family, sensor kinase CheA